MLIYLLISSAFASEALDMGLDAAYIQSGLKDNVERLGAYVAENANRKVPMFTKGMSLYMVYHTQSVTFPVNSCSVTVHLDNVTLKWNF